MTNNFVTIMKNFNEINHFDSPKQLLKPIRSSHQRCSVKKGVLRKFAKFTGKHLCQSHFLNKVADFRPATLIKKRLWHRCFPVNFTNFLRTLFLQNTSGRLLLTNSTISYLSVRQISLTH